VPLSDVPQSLQNFLATMRAPQSLQYLATGVDTAHTGQGIIGSAETWVGTALRASETTATCIVDSMGEMLAGALAGMIATGGIMACMSTVPDFSLFTTLFATPEEAGGDEGEAGG
jgi:hypothetical protein